VVLVDDTSEAVASAYVQPGDLSRIADRFGYRTERGCLIHGLVGTVPVVVFFELPQRLCVPKTSSTSCDQAVFVDHATGVSASSDAVLIEIDRFGQRFQRRGAVQGAVRPVLIVVDLVLAQNPP
jgi:hypothetical protein